MTTKIYTRPSGNDIEINDTEETRALAESYGWKAKATPKKKAKSKES
jgi:hypothetical protein